MVAHWSMIKYCNNFIQQVNDLKPITQEAIRFYTELITRLIDAAAASVELPEDIWRMQAAAGLLLRALEPATSQASTVRTFGFRCDISTDDMRRCVHVTTYPGLYFYNFVNFTSRAFP